MIPSDFFTHNSLNSMIVENFDKTSPRDDFYSIVLGGFKGWLELQLALWHSWFSWNSSPHMNSKSCASVQILDHPFPKTKYSVCGFFSVHVSCVAYEPAFPWLCGFIFDNSGLWYLKMPTFAVIRTSPVVCASNTTVGVLSGLWIWDPLSPSFNQNQAERLFARRKLLSPNLTRLEGRQP